MNRNILIFGLLAIILLLSQSKSADQTVATVLKAERIELVDGNGKVRASLRVEDGTETVFRLMDESGAIRVKLAASRDGSGLVLLNDSTNVGIHALAKKDNTFLKVEADGKEKKIAP